MWYLVYQYRVHHMIKNLGVIFLISSSGSTTCPGMLFALLLSLLSLSCSSLHVPARPAAHTERSASRRTAIKRAATGIGMLPLFASPEFMSATQLGQAQSVAEGNELAVGFDGGIRSDIGPSIMGSGVEILVTDLSYKELDACPKGFFIPAKGGPWSCLEITATVQNQVRSSRDSTSDALPAACPSG